MNVSHINICFDDGGLGDCIARLVPIKFIENHNPNIIVHLIVPDFFKEFATRCFESKNIIIKSFTDVKSKPKLLNKSYPTYGFAQYQTRMNNLACHMVDHAFHIMNFHPKSPQDKNYPIIDVTDIKITQFGLPEAYAVIATGYTSEVREFLPSHINAITAYMNSIGITPVFLGSSASSNGAGHVITPVFKDEVNYSAGLNLINKTPILETTKIIQGAKFIVGLDNGLIHIAGCTEIPIVAGFTTLYSEHRLPYRHAELGWNCFPVELTDDELNCRGCQSKLWYAYGWDFKKCFVGTKACLQLLDSNKYIQAIKKIN